MGILIQQNGAEVFTEHQMFFFLAAWSAVFKLGQGNSSLGQLVWFPCIYFHVTFSGLIVMKIVILLPLPNQLH